MAHNTDSAKQLLILAKKVLPKRNTYFLVRHGFSKNNEKKLLNGGIRKSYKYPLTEKGVEAIQHAATQLKNKNIDIVLYSPLFRTAQTAKIIGQELNIKPKKDNRLRETDFGTLENSSETKHRIRVKNPQKKFTYRNPNGETYREVTRRVLNFLNEVEKQHKDENICIISHEDPLRAMQWLMTCPKVEHLSSIPSFKQGAIKKLNVRALPITKQGDVDLKTLQKTISSTNRKSYYFPNS